VGGVGRRRDAALAGVVLVAATATAPSVAAPPSREALVAGAVGMVVVEAATQTRREQVRQAWARPAVQAGGLLVALAVVAGAAAARAGWVLWVAVGGLAAYLVLLGAVEAWTWVRPGTDRR
jgi:UDP-N-acetylmuramyl pentapeptide phosphotransferase/UDP-N-acetylglucosamine-1-phosphate transferase